MTNDLSLELSNLSLELRNGNDGLSVLEPIEKLLDLSLVLFIHFHEFTLGSLSSLLGVG